MPELTGPSSPLDEFAEDVRRGLVRPGQKELPPTYFYDAIGSALFDVICLLPEYGLGRAGARLVRRHARDLGARLSATDVVAELGSGSGRQTRLILDALAHPATYYAIDVSLAALEECRRGLSSLGTVAFIGLHARYLDGLRQVASRREPGDSVLVLFLGSTIGNFERAAGRRFLGAVRAALDPGDYLLLGTDLVKPIEQLLCAYDDPLGVTAAFNKNLLARINRQLGGDFNLARFRHRVRFDEVERRVEMHLESLADQTVTIAAAGLKVAFAAGETIWTESSHKFTCEEVTAMGEEAGFGCEVQWADEEWPFALSLLRAR